MSSRPTPGEERGRIVAAFTRVVAERGYRAATSEQTIERAGVDRSAFDRHFAGKEDCFLAASDVANAKFLIHAASAFTGRETWRESVAAMAAAILAFVQECPNESRLQFEARNAGEAARTRLEAQMDVLIELIDLGRRELADPDSLTRATAEAVAGAVFERVAMWLNRGADEDLPNLVPELMFMVLQPYLGAEEARKELSAGGVGGARS